MFLITLTATLTVLLTLVHAYTLPQITGHDFDFTAVYPSGLELSTLEPSTGILPPEEIPLVRPILTLVTPDEAALAARYIAFLEISRIPPTINIDDVVWAFPWTKMNLIVLANGTLAEKEGETRTRYYNNKIEGGEVRNATMHVWRQTPELMAWIATEDAKPYNMPIWITISTVWANITDTVSKDFPRANIDFKVQNPAGAPRCDVDNNGAPISGLSVGATACISETTKATTRSSSSATRTVDGGGVTPSPTGSVSTAPTTTPNPALRAQRANCFRWPEILSITLLTVAIGHAWWS